MKDFDIIKNIWQEQQTEPGIDYKTVLNQFKKSRNQFSLKIKVGLITMVATLILISILWILMPFTSATSHLALFIFVACCIYYIAVQIKNLRTLNNNNLFDKPADYITYLQAFKKSRTIENTRNYTFYTLAMGLGFILYFIEFFKLVNTFVVIFAVVISISWFVLSYLFLKKTYIKKENQLFDALFEDLEKLKKQFEDKA